MLAGQITLEETITNGTIILCGMGTLIDNSQGAIVNAEDLLNSSATARASWVTSAQFVCVDLVNGVAGTEYPIGTHLHPVNNEADAITIANLYGIRSFSISGAFTPSVDYSEWDFYGESGFLTDTFNFNGKIFTNVKFHNIKIIGVLTAVDCSYENCFIEDVDGISGEVLGGRFHNSIKIEPGGYLSGVNIVVEGDETTVDLQNIAGTTASFDVDSGYILFVNSVSECLIELNIRGGEIELDPSCVGGEFYIEGYGQLYNDSAMTIKGMNLLSVNEIALGMEATTRTLGLSQENYYMDQPQYNVDGRLISARLRTYLNPASVGTDDDVLASYNVVSVWNGSNLMTYAVQRIV